ncbi:MAG: hypothetical protein Q9163_002895 [Psora crenata]
MINAANGPVIPERTSARISLSNPKDRKPNSLPASPLHQSRRRTKNDVVVKPASPEVITSLIETLSAISSTAEHHFDNLPHTSASHSTPVSPSAWDIHTPRLGRGVRAPPSPLVTGFGMDDDCVSDSTSRSQRSRLRSENINGTPVRRVPPIPHTYERSTAQNTRETAYEDLLHEAYSIGNVSVEPGVSLDPAPMEPKQRRSVKSLRSARSFRSLTLKDSMDSLRKHEIYIHPASKGKPQHKHDRAFIPSSPSSPLSPKPATIKQRPTPLSSLGLHCAGDTNSVQPSPTSRRLHLDSENTISFNPDQSKRSSYSFPYQDQIPTRDSSKRHCSSFANRRKRPRPPQSEHSVTQDSDAEAGDEEFHTPPSTPPPAIVESDEASVNRRIEELKEQKAKREQLSAEAASSGPNAPVMPTPSSSPPPLSTEQTLLKEAAQIAIPQTPNSDLEVFTLQDKTEEIAPSPTISQRAQRSNDAQINTSASKAAFVKHSPATSRDDTNASLVKVPQRGNSKLLRRLSHRPTTPTSVEKSRRRGSNPLGQATSNRNPSYQTDRGNIIDDAVQDYLSSPRLSQKITHPQTGRVISFSEVGDPEGSVVICCVGMGLTRFITAFYDELATTLKLRLITPDRPGVGDSEPHADGKDTPLGWPDDVRTICEQRGITKFSILAHSAGAIYALATALRMPQHIRCRVHLLAPWIPPSQMSVMGTQQEPLPATAIPYSQRFLRSIPTTFLRAANSSFLSVTSNSITTSLPRSPRRSKRSMSKSLTPTPVGLVTTESTDTAPPRPNWDDTTHDKENRSPPFPHSEPSFSIDMDPGSQPKSEILLDNEAHRTSYEAHLASSIWDASTTNANPSVDLLVCLERKQPIGFRYVDITRAVVIHHGSKDSRVPVENVKWLGKMMRRCEVRVLEGEGHGLMASAAVMGNVLMEIAGEWGDWNRVVQGGKKG